MNKGEFLKAVTYMGIVFNKEIGKDIIEIWYEFFLEIPANIFKSAIKELAKETKYLPSVQELLDKCSKVQSDKLGYIAQIMYEDGYFHIGIERLSDEHAMRNYEKTITWLKRGTVPGWLKEDMQEYLERDNQLKVESVERLQIKC